MTATGVQTDDGFGTGIFNHVFELMGGVYGRDRYDHSPDFLNTQKGDDPLDAVGNVNQDFIAFGYAQLGQRAGKALA